MHKKNQLFIFFKAQASAFIGGISDYIIMVFCTGVFGIFYPISIVIGGICGAVINFSINRKWTFKAENGHLNKQLVKFITVVFGSICLKSGGTYLFTTWSHIDYKITRIIVDLIVSLGFNYTLQKYWVFKHEPPKDSPGIIF